MVYSLWYDIMDYVQPYKNKQINKNAIKEYSNNKDIFIFLI